MQRSRAGGRAAAPRVTLRARRSARAAAGGRAEAHGVGQRAVRRMRGPTVRALSQGRPPGRARAQVVDEHLAPGRGHDQARPGLRHAERSPRQRQHRHAVLALRAQPQGVRRPARAPRPPAQRPRPCSGRRASPARAPAPPSAPAARLPIQLPWVRRTIGRGARRGQARVPDAQAGVPGAGRERAALGQPLHAAHAALVRAQHRLRAREEVVPGAPAARASGPRRANNRVTYPT